jgi:hypothetical protein
MTQVGQHIFYRWTGPWGEPGAFVGRYAGREAELSPALLASLDPRTQGLYGQPAGPVERKITLAVAGEVRTYTVVDPIGPGGVQRARMTGAIFAPRRQATPDEIKRTYRVLAKQYHPDVNKAANATEIFNAITEAYEVLSDPKLRAEYDKHGAHHGHAKKKPADDSGVSSGHGQKAGRASPAQVRLERTLLLSLIVPGLFQIAGNEKKFGYTLLIVYIILSKFIIKGMTLGSIKG